MWKPVILLPIVWVITASMFHESAVGKSHGGCNVTNLNHKTGSFYPNNETLYPSFMCFWEIVPALEENATGPVSLLFHKLFLDEGDEVMVYKQLSNETGKQVPIQPILKDPIRAQNGSVSVVTGSGTAVVAIKGANPHFIRDFEVMYAHECRHPVPPEVEILHSPIIATNVGNESVECIFAFNPVAHKRVKQMFTFLEFINLDNVHLQGSTADGDFSNNPPTDFFITEHNSDPLILTVKVRTNTTDSYILKITDVDKECSELIEIDVDQVTQRKSPPLVLNNGTIVSDCRWIIKHKDTSKVLGLNFDVLDFQSVFDIVAVNDGLSELSTPLLQVTTSNRNYTKNQVIRSAKGAHFWISFRPVNYASRFAFNVTVHGQGGYMENSGTFSMVSTTGDDTAYLLEVPKNEIVMLTFSDSSFAPAAAVSIYDDFDKSTLLTTIQGTVKYPVLSRSSRMMVVGTNFSDKANHFTANFKGVSPSCNHMSTLSTENYILTEICNSTCTWVISPQNTQNSEWIIYFQYLSLNAGDTLEIHQLDAALTQLGVITSNVTHVPHIAVPVNMGALVKVTQADCKAKSDKVVLIGHASILPDCKKDIPLKPSDIIQISSPLYPDTYPLFSTCQWNLYGTVPKYAFVHLAFEYLKLAENHCVTISNKTKHVEFDGHTLPGDLFLSGEVHVNFDSSNCSKKKVGQSLKADTGFLLNVTLAECGQVLEGKSGEFSTSLTGNETVCIWKIDVTDKTAVNTISYSMSKTDKVENYELSVFDGASVRDRKIINNTGSEVWSRSSQLIFIYKRLNSSMASSVLVFKYNTITCNSSMQCDNHVCLHPDWRCNGVDDCGDYSDERNCQSLPVDPEEKLTGYSSVSFWLCIFAMLLLGIICGLVAPICYRNYRDSRYARFRELSGIDG